MQYQVLPFLEIAKAMSLRQWLHSFIALWKESYQLHGLSKVDFPVKNHFKNLSIRESFYFAPTKFTLIINLH